ncbi:hypothetical protein [Butyrivibrio fibrisolvens]|uniref:hypothetical protein n=1 Tax=Butyrivibrio fibrisolvens TaxID=831 RepID=UPI000419D1A8|nr:hypothetical protein [Butyrivibrio fibrisolvens]
MGLKINDEIKNIALGAALRPGDSYKAAAYGTLSSSSGLWALIFFGGVLGGSANKSVFVIPTDNTIKLVQLGTWNTSKVEQVFDIPYGELTKVKHTKGSLGAHFIKFRVGKVRYWLTMTERCGKNFPGQKENVQIISQIFADIQKAQRAQKVKKAS